MVPHSLLMALWHPRTIHLFLSGSSRFHAALLARYPVQSADYLYFCTCDPIPKCGLLCELLMTKVTSFQMFPNTLWLRHDIGSHRAFLLPMPVASLLDWSYTGSLLPRPMNSLHFLQCRLLWTCTTTPTIPRGIECIYLSK